MTIEGRTDGASGSALDAVAEASRALTTGGTLREALASIAAAAASATGAEVVVARVLAADARQLKAHAVWAVSPAVAAELEGSRFAVEELPAAEVDEVARLPKAVQLAAERARAGAVLQVPIVLDDAVLASLELMRPRMRFSADERVLARLFAHQIGLAIRAFGAHGAAGERDGANGTLELAGEALAAGSDELRTAEQVTRLATEATGALGALLWRAAEEDEGLELLGSFGLQAAEPEVARAGEAAGRALAERQPVAVEAGTATILLGEPPVGALQLLFAGGNPPSEEALAHLSTFGVRVADALRAGERARSLEGELERTRTLLAVVGQAIAQLSLAHTLETAVGRVAELLGAERLAVYLRDDGRLGAAAGRGLAGPHVRGAERLLQLAVGPYRGRGILVVEDAAADPQLSPAADAVAEAGIEAAVALPLHVHDDVIGLLAVYPPRRRPPSTHEAAFLSALESELGAERQAARQLRALYEISRSFAQTLSLETTLEAVARTVVELLEVDAAVIRMPDERRELLVSRAIHVAHPRLDEAGRALLARPPPLEKLLRRRLFRLGRPRSQSTTPVSTSSRRTSPTRCSGRSSRASRPTSRGSSSAPSTSRRRGSTSAATSTTTSGSRTAGSRSCSATSRGTGSRPRPTWRWRSSSSARSRASTPSPPTSSPPRTTSSSARSRRASSSPWPTSSWMRPSARSPAPAQVTRRPGSSAPTVGWRRSPRPASRSGSKARRAIARLTRRSRRRRASSSSRTASSRPAAAASSSDSSGSTRSSCEAAA